MRITKISVKGLFGMFDHEILLNQESRITIVHGPNGVGKTVMLRLLHSIFHFGYDFVSRTPFEVFRIDFEGGDYLTVRHEDPKSLLIDFQDSKKKEWITFSPELTKNPGNISEYVRNLRPDLEEVSTAYEWNSHYWVILDALDKGWIGADESVVFTWLDLLRKYPSLHTEVYGEMPDWFVSIQKAASPKLISTTRLKQDVIDAWQLVLALHIAKSEELGNRFSVPSTSDAVSKIATEIGVKAHVFLSHYEGVNEINREINELEAALNADAVKESETATDLLEERVSFFKEDREEILDDFKYVLGNLFIDILNERLLFKSLKIEDYKFKFLADDGSDVPLLALSSGEQQLLVLYYQLIFEIQPETLVMIDEPELSMNVVWQRKFLEDLQRIIELRDFDVLIATHSPQIIHDKWDWMVALGEKVDD